MRILFQDLKITHHGSNSNLYIPVPISTAKANNCNLNIKISIADGKPTMKTKKIQKLQVTSPPPPASRKQKPSRTKNEKTSKKSHCYEEIPPLPTSPTRLTLPDQRRPSTATSDHQQLLSTTTFESAPEFLSDEVQYEEVGNIVKHETLLQKTPSGYKPTSTISQKQQRQTTNNHSSGDERKCKQRSTTPPKRPPPPKFENRLKAVEHDSESETPSYKRTENVIFTIPDGEVTGRMVLVDEDIIVPVMTEHLLESIPRQPVPPTRPQPPEPTNHSPPRDDSLEPSLCNTTREVSKDTTSLYDITKELPEALQTSPEGTSHPNT